MGQAANVGRAHKAIVISRVVRPVTIRGNYGQRNKYYYRASCLIKGVWEEGRTPSEAIGQLLLTYPSLFGFTIEEQEAAA